MSAGVVPLVPLVPVIPVELALPDAVVPPEAARGVDPQEWALAQRAYRSDDPRRRSSSSASPRQRPRLTALDTQLTVSSGSLSSPESPNSNNVQIIEFIKTNCKTEEYVDKIVPKIVSHPHRLKDVPDISRSLTRVPEGFREEKDVLEDLGHKSPMKPVDEESDEVDVDRKQLVGVPVVNLLKSCPLKYLDESRCVDASPRRLRLRSLSPLAPLSALSHRLPLPRHLRQLTVKNIKLSIGKLCRRRTVVITESDPTYKVAYLGNVLTGWAKGEGCAEKPLSTLWKNYTASNKPDVSMKLAVTRSGLKATTREHGLTEYWSHRITHCAAPPAFPRVFCWVYRHEGRKLKQELRCHAVLCAREDQARRMAQQLTERLALALLEFRRDKRSREQARLSLANALYDNPSLPQRKLLLSTGASNYRPPLERSKSAPKLGAIEESAEEEEGEVFGHPRTVARFLREERLASTRRQRFRESLRRKIAQAKLVEEPEPELEPEDLVRHDVRRDTLTIVRADSIEEEPDPSEDCDERVRVDALQRLPEDSVAPASAPSTTQVARRFLLDSDADGYRQDESDEGSSSLQSISSDGSQGAGCTGSHSRTDSGEDFCLGADALKTIIRNDPDTDCLSWCGAADLRGLEDDFDDNVSDESGYVEAAPEALVKRAPTKDHTLVKTCILRGQQCLQV